MFQLIMRGLAAGFVVVLVSEIAQRSSRLAALILFVPIVVPLVFVAMYLKNPAVGPVSGLARQSLMLIPLSLPLFIPMAFAERWGLTFWSALAMGLALLVATIGGYLWLTAR
jgi:hypothetical protein